MLPLRPDPAERYTGPVLFLRWLVTILEEVAAGRLSPAAGHLAGVLAAHYQNRTEACELGERTLRKLTGRRTVKRTRNELEAAGWLTSTVGVYHSPTAYRLAVPPHLDLTKTAQSSHKRARKRHASVRGDDTPTNAQRARVRHETNSKTNETNDGGARRTAKDLTLNEEEARRSLRKAVGRVWAERAEQEVRARLEHDHPVLRPFWSEARAIAECYRNRCRTPGCELHGIDAYDYHVARRGKWADESLALRARSARRRGPSYVLPESDDIEDIEGSRRRQLEALRTYNAGAAETVSGFDEA